jgi:E3 ubiquitin-protein ligase ZSWIM2
MEEAVDSTFFLVQETGPTSFVIKDAEEHKFKVSLGFTHSCSCGGGVKEHCLHTLYTLIKIFKLPCDNPIVWQLSYIDTDIAFICRNRFQPSQKPRPKKVKPVANQRIPLSEEFCW